jgi:YVTN family beta-propeller protein
MRRILVSIIAIAHLVPVAAGATPLILEAKIPLGDIKGRIDHLAFDPARERLYVAELGNDSIGIVDLKGRRVMRTVSGFAEPQGIAYEADTDTLFVANGGDGSVRLFSGADFTALGQIALRADADNVRVDRSSHFVYVGYGNGALAVIDARTRQHVADIPLKGHPEGFALDPGSDRIFVNVPEARQIAVVSRDSRRQTGTWATPGWRSNYPMAVENALGRVITAFRQPAHLQTYDSRTGAISAGVEICADPDDIFVDEKRSRIHVICGEGYVDTFESTGGTYTRVGRFSTSPGSRTGLLVPELDRLVIANRASQSGAAAIWVLRPSP